MNHTGKTIGDYLAALRRRKRRFIVSLTLMLLVVLSIAIGLPPVYQSSAIILIEQQEIPQELVRSTITSYADQRIQMISQRVMTRSNLMKIIDRYDLYSEEREVEPTEVIIEQMREDIGMDIISAEVVDPRSGRPVQATIAFTISYDNESPKLSQSVANDLVSLYLNENLRNRTEMATEASEFLADEAGRLAIYIAGLEENLANFKQENSGQLPELFELNLQLMDRTDREYSEVENQLRSLNERIIYLESELAQVPPHSALYSENGERILSPGDRLKMAQTRHATLSAQYSDNHPDLIRLQKEIEALSAEVNTSEIRKGLLAELSTHRSELVILKKRYSDNHPDIKRLQETIKRLEMGLEKTPASDADSQQYRHSPDNPVYVALNVDLTAAKVEQSALQAKQQHLGNKLIDFERRLTQAPQVEREYRMLSRDYENAYAKYREIKAKQMEAQLAKELESGRKGERFTLIEPPQFPEEPVDPNRFALALVGTVLALLLSFSIIAVSEVLDRSVRGRKMVASLTGMMPLATIPVIKTESDYKRETRQRRIMGASVMCSFVVLVSVIHLFVIPLDVAWHAALRRISF